jgi:hypothetical protein
MAAFDDERIRWNDHEHAWEGEPEAVLSALRRKGYDDYRYEIVRTPGVGTPDGGFWHGRNAETGKIASAVWVNSDDALSARVFVVVSGVTITP